MPDDLPKSTQISLRLPSDLLDGFDNLAKALGRPRSWVMERALRCYLEDEATEILEDSESLGQLDRGDVAPFEDTLRKVREIIERAQAKRAHPK